MSSLEDFEDVLTVAEAAKLVRVHPVTIQRAVRRGELPHYRVFGRIRITLADLDRFVARAFHARNAAPTLGRVAHTAP